MPKTVVRFISFAKLPAVWLPCLILFVLTVFFRFTEADLATVRHFFAGIEAGPAVADRWPKLAENPWKFLYDWGVVPAWILGCSGLLVWILSFFWKKLQPLRDPGLYCALVLIIGPGIMVNGILKPCCGRPRPNALIEFGGTREFVPVLSISPGQNDASFPSGHASMGFYLMTPAFVLFHRRRWLAITILVFGILAGCIIGMARIVVGGHFPSDILWTGGVVYFTALFMAIPFGFIRRSTPAQK